MIPYTDQLHFVSGLPRSGSTLLMNLLGQNPNYHVTATNDLVSQFSLMQRNWTNQPGFRAQGLHDVKFRMSNSMAGMLTHFYHEEVSQGKIIFDKSRGWTLWAEMLQKVLDRPNLKIILTVRDIRDVLVSLEKLYRSRDIDWHYPTDEDFFLCQFSLGRAEYMLKKDKLLGFAINQVIDLVDRGPKSVHIVSYNQLTSNPLGTLERLHTALGLDFWDGHDPNNVEQITIEDDTYHGMGSKLHKVKTKIQPQEGISWRGIYNDQFADAVAKQYSRIHDLCR